MDSVTKGQRNLLLFILGVAIIVLPIRFLAMGNFDDKKSIDSERQTREAYYNDLKVKDADRQTYIDGTTEYQTKYQEILDKFPSELYQDNTLMYLQGVKDDYDFNFPSVSMGEESLFYTLGSGAVGDVSVDTSADASAETSEVSLDDTAVSAGYNCYSASFPVSYEGDYKDVKDVIDFIESGDTRMTVDDINIAFDEGTGLYAGSMTITSYAISGEDRTTDHADVNVQIGTTNIFGNPTVKSDTATTTTTTAE